MPWPTMRGMRSDSYVVRVQRFQKLNFPFDPDEVADRREKPLCPMIPCGTSTHTLHADVTKRSITEKHDGIHKLTFGPRFDFLAMGSNHYEAVS